MDLRAQTFTLEGVAASLLLLIAVYTIFQSTVVLSPSWSEFANIQLKQLAYDALRILDNPQGGNNSLYGMLRNATCVSDVVVAPPEFNETMSAIMNNLTAYGRVEVLWVNGSEIERYVVAGFDSEPTPNAVRVSRFVVLDVQNLCFGTRFPKVLEVRLTLWRT